MTSTQSQSPSPSPIKAPPHVLTLLDRLHHLSRTQEDAVTSDQIQAAGGFDNYMRDKFIALDQDKCHFIYQLCRATNAKNVVEAGTSFGVSTIYLALAVSGNVASEASAEGSSESTEDKAAERPRHGTVIATEYEKSKADQARAYWKEVGPEITGCIELREGDILETLKQNLPVVDLLLLDSKRTLQTTLSQLHNLMSVCD
ncbi:hypothetical protein KCU88_g5010, partial [Aureobasidium melanogenum]